jgi:hypothetical protein
VLTKPDEQTKETGALKQELAGREIAERHLKRRAFWTRLLEKSKSRTALGANKSPSDDHWLSVSVGISGIYFNYLILKDYAAVDLYIDVGDKTKNKSIFDALLNQKTEIEADFGGVLEWRRLDDKRTSRIVKVILDKGDLRHEETWDSLQDEMIDVMLRMDQTFRNRLPKLRHLLK